MLGMAAHRKSPRIGFHYIDNGSTCARPSPAAKRTIWLDHQVAEPLHPQGVRTCSPTPSASSVYLNSYLSLTPPTPSWAIAIPSRAYQGASPPGATTHGGPWAIAIPS